MNTLALALLFLLQGPPTGAVTGRVVSPEGAPSAGIRVYAAAVKDNDDPATALTVFESLTQTDDSGRYRLEVPAGRYRIAAGSVDSPTYFPGTTNAASARVVSVAAGTVVDTVDISGFVPARTNPAGTLHIVSVSSGTGVMSGVIRMADGTPAVGWAVALVPVGGTNAVAVNATGRIITIQPAGAPFAPPAPPALPGAVITAAPPTRIVTTVVAMAGGPPSFNAQTDLNGRYRIQNIPPGTYTIAAGFAESATYYPGSATAAGATPVVTTPTTNIDNLDFTVAPVPPGVSIRGKIESTFGLTPGSAAVSIQPAGSNQAPGVPGLPRKGIGTFPIAPDGTFNVQGVLPGSYLVRITHPGVRATDTSITVGTDPIEDLAVKLPVSRLSGRIVWEDGSPFTEGSRVGSVGVMTVDNPNIVASTLLSIRSDGTFERLIDADRYRFFLRELPEEYTVRSIAAGTANLLTDNLTAAPDSRIDVEVRIARGGRSDAPDGVEVSGTVLNLPTPHPPNGFDLQMCCLSSGALERLTARIAADGTFRFPAVPPGSYTPQLTGMGNIFLATSQVDVGREPLTGLNMSAASRLVSVVIVTQVEGPASAAAPPLRYTVVFVNVANGQQFPVPTGPPNGIGMLPAGVYTVRVLDLPSGHVVRSVTGGVNDLLNGGTFVLGATGTTGSISVTIGRPQQD